MYTKICGIVTEEDARLAVRLGASAVGLNFVRTSPRCVTITVARALSRAARDEAAALGRSVLVVGVVADLDAQALRILREDAELGCLQLHGSESPDTLAALLPHAYKAVRIQSEADVASADTWPGDHLLVDAFVPGVLGGTGQVLPWELVVPLARRRRLTLAGGLHPDNVARAIEVVRPYCVDVASGVEADPTGSPGKKDPARVAAFISHARAAFSASPDPSLR
jgi:phosphoribosylanthranilate isomerase